MAIDLSETLVVGISATALFDLSESDQVYREQLAEDPDNAVKAYREYMVTREDEPLDDGTSLPLVKALLDLNQYQPEGESPLVEVVVISRNSPETGYRVLKEIRRRNLPIKRSAFIAGESSVDYLEAFYVDLFLTTNEDDAQKIVDSGVCAAAIVKAPAKGSQHNEDGQVRFAFDADAVLFNEESELVYKTQGLPAFQEREDKEQDTPLPEGPHANLLRKLSSLKERLPGSSSSSPVRIAIMTARSSPAEMRVIKTLKAWNVSVDQTFFLGGMEKRRFLTAFKPHIFFDDQDTHLDLACNDIPSAKVLYPSHSPLKNIKAPIKE